MHTKEMIMEALVELHKGNPNVMSYGFSMTQISEKIGRTTATTGKWCLVLAEEGKLIKTNSILRGYFGVRLVEVN